MTEDRNIAEVLAEVAEHAEQTRDAFTRMYRSERPPTDPSQVYSIRIPVSRLGKIRRLAARYKMPPTSMLRQWILERLDLEERSGGSGGGIIPPSSQQVTSILYIPDSRVFAALDPDVIEREFRAGGVRMAGV